MFKKGFLAPQRMIRSTVFRRRFFSKNSKQICSLMELKSMHGKGLKFEIELTYSRKSQTSSTAFAFFCQQTKQPRAFVNRCPHAKLDLDMDDGDFFWYEYIKCKAHGAIFDPETGVCLQGPGARRQDRLQELNVTIDDNDIVHVGGVKEKRSVVDQEKVKAKVEAIRQILSCEDISEMREEVEAKALSRIRYYKLKGERVQKE